MNIRNRLLMFSTAQLVVFGALCAIAFVSFERTVMPLFDTLLRGKAEWMTRIVSSQLDVALGADDPSLIAAEVQYVRDDPDFRYVVVRDADGNVVFSRGTSPRGELFGSTPYAPTVGGDEIRTWAPVSLEGLSLGSVAVVFSTARLDHIQTVTKQVAIGVAVLWVLALGYSVLFARSFVAPIRTMMDFSRTVANGSLSQRLTILPPGELGELRDHLNGMTADLEERERERKIAGAKAEVMQQELISVSRMAGMAEIATGVLHDVGNVLNSLNVSVSIIDNAVRNSRIAGFTKTVDVFEAHPGGLIAFLATENGRVVPGYLSSVAKRLAKENAQLLGELASVTRNIDHIKSIVTMQQSYARPGGFLELVALGPLIDDALRMGESSFANHGIELVKDYGDTETITTDRHKLLQILINVISNARHAVKDVDRSTRRITVGVRASSEGVEIAIADTGVGIPPGNLDKIFQHGFTTKKGGHGFGLHASANTARELSGTLSVASEGEGAGATFTLMLRAQMKGHHELAI
ncbi:MAG: HAMP domain-containing protein [Deltaproteobacteria bacterium]|nr:HAMP domain-containing protein [Deltaproteobacteria bacterium]